MPSPNLWAAAFAATVVWIVFGLAILLAPSERLERAVASAGSGSSVERAMAAGASP